MKIEEHIAKADRIEATMNRLDPAEDYVTVIWALMHICTHWLNAALHAREVTDADWDISHSYGLHNHPEPARLEKLDDGFRKALAALGVIENIRYTHVRGRGDYNVCIIENIMRACSQLKEFCGKTVAAEAR